MRERTFSRLAFALALALASLASYANASSLSSYANAALECAESSSGQTRARGFGLPRTQDLIEWYEGSSITVNGDKVTGWTSSVAYDDNNGKGCYYSQVETHNNYLLNARKKSVSGHGATKAVDVLSGDTTVTAFFSGGRYIGSNPYQDTRHAFKTEWTFCTLARYSGANRGRIFKGTANMYHGFHGGRRGVCYYHKSGNCGDGVGGTQTDWLIMCTHNGDNNKFVVGSGSTRVTKTSSMTTAVGDKYFPAYFGINNAKGCDGNQCSSEKSDFEVAEILVWRRRLKGSEMMQVYNHLYLDVLGYHSPPSPPPLPPPSPPPPSPPPPGSSMPPVVTISNAPKIVTSYKFNFGVKVAHDSCEGHESDCFASDVVVDEVMNELGLKCDASVRSEGADCSSGDGEFLPCIPT
jgi:hypothetical protein